MKEETMRQCRNTVLLWVLVGFVWVPGAAAMTAGSGRLVSVHPALSGFSRIWLSHACQARIRPGDRFDVEVRIDDNLVDFLVVEQNGEVLSIGLEDGGRFVDYDLEVDITLPLLYELRMAGASAAELSEGFSAPSFDCKLSGASRLEGKLHTHAFSCKLSGASRLRGFLRTDVASFRLSGASRAEVDGRCGQLAVKASGASQAWLGGVSADAADVKMSGASKGGVRVDGRLDAGLSGASQLAVAGRAEMGRLSISGGSRLETFTSNE
ncbi:MAG: DUF2807 domain-containing protein [Desulfobacteraceae bacterium]|nr:DUF2807 domain-containing protein [Desulfobacteraceae bacterium]